MNKKHVVMGATPLVQSMLFADTGQAGWFVNSLQELIRRVPGVAKILQSDQSTLPHVAC